MAARQAGAPSGTPPSDGAPAAAPQATPPPASRRWHSTELFGPGQEIEIEHGQSVYRLRQTALGKLILTK